MNLRTVTNLNTATPRFNKSRRLTVWAMLFSFIVQVTGLSGMTVVAVASGNLFFRALSSAGTVYTWGDNTNGELGR